MRDGVRVGVFSKMYGNNHAFIHTVCVLQAETQFPTDEHRKKPGGTKAFFIKCPKGTKVFFY